MSIDNIKIILAGGGTGGHVIPAIAIAEEIIAMGGSARFVGTADRIEAKLVPESGFGIDFIKVLPLAGVSPTRMILSLANIPAALATSVSLLSRIRPNAVLGVGGYVAGPLVLAARLTGIPTAVLEQNATVGLTNKILARIVNKAFVSYEDTVSEFPGGRALVTGNPVKKSIVEAAVYKRENPRPDGPIRIIVMGGSQGARSVDIRVPQAMGLAGFRDEVEILHQCTKEKHGDVVGAYEKAGVKARVVPFIDDTAAEFKVADLVVCRSGATTVSELTVMGLPAVFLPYPHHDDEQQKKNAAPMVEAGAAVVVDEKTTSVSDLAEEIARYVRNGEYLNRAAAASQKLGRPEAAQTIAKALLSMGGNPKC